MNNPIRLSKEEYKALKLIRKHGDKACYVREQIDEELLESLRNDGLICEKSTLHSNESLVRIRQFSLTKIGLESMKGGVRFQLLLNAYSLIFEIGIIGMTGLILSVMSIIVGNHQIRIAEKEIYPLFRIVMNSYDGDGDGIHDTTYIDIINFGGNFYKLDCATASFYLIETQGGSFYMPVYGLFFFGEQQVAENNVFRRTCWDYIRLNHLPSDLYSKYRISTSMMVFIKVTYQDVDKKLVDEYFNAKTGERLEQRVGEYYFSQHKDNHLDLFSNGLLIYSDDSEAEIMKKIVDMVNSDDKAVQGLRIEPY